MVASVEADVKAMMRYPGKIPLFYSELTMPEPVVAV
jgi:hypothetical protein